jgi:hypothetical protein
MFPMTLGPPPDPQFVDPYEAQMAALRKKMEQPPAPLYTPEQIGERRATNQREYELGLLGQLSGNEQLGNVGGQIFKRALAQRDPRLSERGSTDQLSGQFQYSPDYMRQHEEMQMAALESKSAQERSRFDAARASAEERRWLATQGLQNQRFLTGERIAAGRDKGESSNDMRRFRGEDAMRTDFDRITKDLREEVYQTSKIQQIVAANAGRRPDAMTQQSLVILLNKFLDPGSVVREGEFDRVVKAQGLDGRAQNMRDYIMKGEPLSAASIQQINGLAALYAQAATAKMRYYGQQYHDIANSRGYDPAAVISDPAYRPGAQPAGGGGGPAPSAGAGSIDVGAALGTPPAAPQVSAFPKATGKGQKRTVQVEY